MADIYIIRFHFSFAFFFFFLKPFDGKNIRVYLRGKPIHRVVPDYSSDRIFSNIDYYSSSGGGQVWRNENESKNPSPLRVTG